MKFLLQVLLITQACLCFVAARAPWSTLDTGLQSAAAASDANQIVQRAVSKRCSHSYTSDCLKFDLFNLVERLAHQKSFPLLEGVNMVRQENEVEPEEARSASASSETAESILASMAKDGPEVAETKLDGLLLDRFSRYLDTHAISIRLFDEDTLSKMRKVGFEAAEKFGYLAAQTGRKDKKGGGALLMGLMMMKATLGALGFGAIAALAGKALMVGMLSMMLSAIVGLKSLASGGGGKAVTYEIISKPVYSHSHSHSHEHSDHGGSYSGGGGYGHGRSLDSEESHDIAYGAQRK